LNPGSLGHPILCARPCLHVFYVCANGSACEFCHIPHAAPPKQLDKQRRESLRSMPPAESQALMLSAIWPKVSRTVGTAAALDRLAAACAWRGMEPAEPREHRRLLTGLRRMTVRHLLAVFTDVMQRHSAEEPRVAAELLLEQLLRPLRSSA